ncbi:MAG: Trm112 family protein [Nevskiales bacterium]
MDKQLLDILVCPQCKGPLHWDEEKRELQSFSELLAYPVRDGIPVMLVEEAREMSPDEVDA